MNPATLHFLLHCYFLTVPYTQLPKDSETIIASTRWLTINGLIAPSTVEEGIYKVTPRGAAHIQQLLNLRLPQQLWVDYEGKEIKV